jgi:hypothetical protein
MSDTSGPKPILGILIDPWKRSVTQVLCMSGDAALHDMYKFIGCDCVDRVVWPVPNSRNDVWIDDNGLLHEPVPVTFNVRGYDQPLAGRGLVLGFTNSGKSVSTTLTIDQVKMQIRWELWELRISAKDAIRMQTKED